MTKQEFFDMLKKFESRISDLEEQVKKLKQSSKEKKSFLDEVLGEDDES